MIAYCISIGLSFAAGFLFIRWLAAGRLNLILHILLSFGLGLGLEGVAAFVTHILLNNFSHWLPVAITVAVTAYLAFLNTGIKTPKTNFKLPPVHGWAWAALVLLAIPLGVSAYHYPLGGWDAWSCWNLKAKFIFLGTENWKDILSPGFWRSNTNYPLLWPLINVWFWDLGGRFDQAVPMLNSILIALLNAGLLIFGLWELTGLRWAPIAAAVITTALPLSVTLYTSQYSDSLLGLYLMSAFLCWLLAEKYDLPKLKIISVILLGLMGFIKNEGLVAGLIAALGLLWQERRRKKELKTLSAVFMAALLPAVYFMLFICPANPAFVNGLTSSEKPVNLSRLVVIAIYPWFEFISAKWCGFWFLTVGAILLAGKKLWRSTLGVMGLTLVLYLGVVMAYYAVNTFFEIGWWLQTTLARILFALLPTIALWLVVGLKPTKAS